MISEDENRCEDPGTPRKRETKAATQGLGTPRKRPKGLRCKRNQKVLKRKFCSDSDSRSDGPQDLSGLGETRSGLYDRGTVLEKHDGRSRFSLQPQVIRMRSV